MSKRCYDGNLPPQFAKNRVAVRALLHQEVERGTFFLFVPVFIGAGAILYFSAATEPRLGAIPFGLTFLFALLCLADARPNLRRPLLLSVAIASGMLFGKLETVRIDTRMLASEVTTRVTGRVTSMARDERGGWRISPRRACDRAADIPIAEDGRLVALRTSGHRLAINRTGGSAFVLDNWQQSYGGAGPLVKPFRAGVADEVQFECTDSLCTARETGGRIVA